MIRVIRHIGVILLFLAPSLLFAQEWIVPDEFTELKNPVEYNKKSVKEGRNIYNAQCKSCHGDPGKNNALALVPLPPDATSEKMLANSPGMLFYKLREGRGAMPSFANTLSEDQRWSVINFLKKFDPVNAGIPVDDQPLRAKLEAELQEDKALLTMTARAEYQPGSFSPLDAGTVLVKVQTAFGALEVGSAKTNQAGVASFVFPEDYPGDAEGKVNLLVMLTDDFICDTIRFEKAPIARKVEPEKLFADKVLWSTNDRTEWWLIMSYVLVVSGVWVTIGYILYIILKIKRSGQS